jgi:hypothetical protein
MDKLLDRRQFYNNAKGLKKKLIPQSLALPARAADSELLE